MKKLFCETCNKELDFVYVFGYNFGDRIMEGVSFKVKVVNNKGICIGVHPDSKPYMIQFNWEYWKKQCEDYCNNLDLAQCPICNDEVLVEDEETAASKPKPIFIGKSESILNILNRIK